MKAGARIQAAIEILGDILDRHRPAPMALADWGRSHRFAGSGDRAAIGNLVYDTLRRKASVAARMEADTPRALAIGAAAEAFGLTPAEVMAAVDGSAHAPESLSSQEAAALERVLGDETPAWMRADVPDWLAPSLTRAFGEDLVAEGQALALRAPIDLRVNALKATRDRVLKALERFEAAPTPFSPLGIRMPAPTGAGRSPNIEAEAGHGKGWYEVQDEGSQIAALLTGAGPRMQVADVCAGAGGKTLALAAAMQNTGQIHAFDADRHRLRPIFDRLRRAGARNVQVIEPGAEDALAKLHGRMDVVLADAPCTGSGVWRRRPDAKWRLKPANLAERQEEQRQVLALAAPLVKPGGRLVYVTCSLLPEENGDQVAWLRTVHPEFVPVPTAEAWQAPLTGAAPVSADGGQDALLLTPRRHATDGFFIAVMMRHV
ncbi:MAG: RsmB/NOP family class I SAM-dependent RNA methyltransferase [Hyphomicrobiaceae bacterium]